MTVTGAEPAAPTGLLGTSDSASVTISKLKTINISLLNCFISVLLTDKTYFPTTEMREHSAYMWGSPINTMARPVKLSYTSTLARI